jgi:hypothetical protein
MYPMHSDAYVSTVHDRMISGGYATSTEILPGGPALIGYRWDFRLSWAATKLHLFVAVKASTAVSRDDIHTFTAEALTYAKRTKGRFRGMQTGVGVIAVLISNHVDARAKHFAQHDLIRQFAAFAWPVIIDLDNTHIYSQTGNPTVGSLYNNWMREQIAATLPNPLH